MTKQELELALEMAVKESNRHFRCEDFCRYHPDSAECSLKKCLKQEIEFYIRKARKQIRRKK